MKTKNLTISLTEDLIKAGKRYAQLRSTSINELIRDFLTQKIVGDSNADSADELLEALDYATVNSNANFNGNTTVKSKGKRWSREDAYTR